MRILLITPVFYPEQYYLRGLPYARELIRRGFEVEVLTGFPNYPAGRIFPDYRQSLCFRECVDGVTIIRVPLYISHNRSGFKRALSYLSLALSMSLQGPFRIQKPDIVHVNQGHGTLCLPADFIQLFRGAPFLLDVQDLWPESVTDSSMFRLPGGDRLLHAWCQYTYRRANHIVTLSDAVKGKLLERGVPDTKITVLHNWCDPELEKPLPPRAICPDPHGLNGTFNVMYAGNFGPLQALGTILEAAQLLPMPNVRFVLIGDGIDEAALKKTAAEKNLNNVIFLPRTPLQALNQILAFADAVLVHLKDTPLNRVGIPSKVQHCLAMGRPILIGAQGASPELVLHAGAGLSFQPENAKQLADSVQQLLAMSSDQRQEMGSRGREYYLANMSFDIGITRLVGVYNRMLA